MTQEQILDIFRKTGVMLEGHFLLTSGRHSDRYMQCARLFEHPAQAELLCKILSDSFTDIDVVIGPALGGILPAYEVARALGAKNVFCERVEGKMTLRRGFAIEKDARVLVVEDVVTTGGSVREAMEAATLAGGQVAGVGVIVDRSAGAATFGVPLCSVISMEVVSYEASECPLCAADGSVPIKPGSRATSGV